MKINFNEIEIKTCFECPFLKFYLSSDKSRQGYICGKGVFDSWNGGFYNQIFHRYDVEIHEKCPFKSKKKINKKR